MLNKKQRIRYPLIADFIHKYSVTTDPFVLSVGWLENSNPFLFGSVVGIDNFCTKDKNINCFFEGFDTLLYGDVSCMPEVSTGVFDVVELGEVVEHINDVVGMFSEVNRVLNEYGIMVISTPNGGCIWDNVWFKDNHKINSWHINLWNVHHLVNFVEQFSFSLIDFMFYNPMMPFKKLMVFSSDVVLVFRKNNSYINNEWINKLK